MADLKTVIEQAFENRSSLSPRTASVEVREAVDETIALVATPEECLEAAHRMRECISKL